MKQLYYNHAYPHLAGETTVWGTDDTTKTYIQPLIKIQKKLIRIICNLPPRAHTKPLMTKHEILNITNIHIHRVCTEIHPYIHQTHRINQPEHDHKYTWTAQIHEHKTRYSQQQHQYIPNPHKYSKAQQPKNNTEHLQQHYSTIWNTLPQQIKQDTNIETFKNNLKHHLLNKQK
jgi:hypothetical protein